MIPSFSVVVPTYNRSADLEASLRSLQQLHSGVDFEVVVVDDGSTDGTATCVKAFDDLPLRYIRQDNQGVSAARNRGAKEATGDFLTFLDTGDKPAPDWLATFGALAVEHHAELVFMACRVLRVPSGREKVSVPRTGQVFTTAPTKFLPGCFAMRAELFEEVGGYDTSIVYGENGELRIRLAKALEGRYDAIASTSTPHLTWVVNDHGSNASTPENRYASSLYLLDKHREHYAARPQLRSQQERIAGVAAARLGRHAEARRLFFASARDWPRDPTNMLRAAASVSPALQRRIWKAGGSSPTADI
ncbi:MAG: glycosyltransferase family 2 protein [Actinobacteria bacterium]|nr:glycosyltransferase family 2 protein [Actinomycetota bacterium]